jgi:two-component system phosphate regulon response regulator PhoB
VVDDEQNIIDFLTSNFVREGYDVLTARSADEAISQLTSSTPDLILLDLMLPGVTGLELVDRIKHTLGTRDTPIIILSANTSEENIIKGLQLGADDYVTKPFSMRVLQARVKAVLRTKRTKDATYHKVLHIRDLSIDSRRHRVSVNGKNIKLTRTEFAILSHLARTPGWVYTRSQILGAIHGSDHEIADRSVDVQILGLRRKLGWAGTYLETVRGVGYRLKGEDHPPGCKIE